MHEDGWVNVDALILSHVPIPGCRLGFRYQMVIDPAHERFLSTNIVPLILTVDTITEMEDGSVYPAQISINDQSVVDVTVRNGQHVCEIVNNE